MKRVRVVVHGGTGPRHTTGVIDVPLTPVDTDRMRIVILDSNDHTYSRLIEVEAY